MVNPLDLDPQIAAAQEIAKALENLKPVWNEILEEFGISKEDDFKGLIPAAVLIYPYLKDAALFLHNLTILEGQIMNYMETLGADMEAAVKTVKSAAKTVATAGASEGLISSGIDTIGAGGII